jgi:hypothetical protein
MDMLGIHVHVSTVDGLDSKLLCLLQKVHAVYVCMLNENFRKLD